MTRPPQLPCYGGWMDTLGAIVGPATTLLLLAAVNHNYPALFALTLIPGLLAVAAITFLVRERGRKPVPHISFWARLRALPPEACGHLLAALVYS